MITGETMEGVVAALQQDLKDLPDCGHASCIALAAVGIEAGSDDACRYLAWLDAEMTLLIDVLAEGPLENQMAFLMSQLAMFWTKALMMGKKLGRVDEEA